MKTLLILIGILIPSYLFTQVDKEYYFKNEFYTFWILINEENNILKYYHKRRGFLEYQFELKGRKIRVISPKEGALDGDKLYFRNGRKILVLKFPHMKFKLYQR